MCGIVGEIDLTGRGRADAARVQRMADAIAHRGPDGDGFYAAPNAALGMRRLSIIDIDGSDQPLYNEDGTLVLVFNGEIYNYRELRHTLTQHGHTLRTEGDGETILHLYEQHGVRLFEHLRGMYAFALWDAKRERLLLAIDHIGMKPQYLYEHDGMLAFASEVKAFAQAGSLTPALNLDTLDTYLSFGYMVGENTLFKGVRRLMPGHYLIAEKGALAIREHWRFGEKGGALAEDEGAIIEQARALIHESVNLHLRSDVPLGLFLSGGIDSAAMLALMSGAGGERVQTYTVGYAADVPDNELAAARRIAAHFDTDHHERVITAEDWWNALPRYAYHHDEPNANASAVSQMLLAQETAKHVKVVLTGLGGDELFGGYPHHHSIPQTFGARITQAHARNGDSPFGWLAGALGMMEAHYPSFKRYRYVGALPTYLPRLRHGVMSVNEGVRRMLSYDGLVLSDALRERLYGTDVRAAWHKRRHKETMFRSIIGRSLQADPYNSAQALVINTWLHGNALLSCDKVTMAYSLEARVPFFDPTLLDFAARIPPSARMKANKHVLREAVRAIVPAFALERPKQPFSTPLRHWFDHELRGRIAEVLLDRGAYVRTLFTDTGLDQVVRAHTDGHAKHEELVLRLLLLELWAGAFEKSFTGSPP
jgi:asparagine synthase (glutamine-hydrolysing)